MTGVDAVGGYEWWWTCGECDTTHGLSGTGGATPIVNGESFGRVRELDDGVLLECAECGHTVELVFREVDDD